MVEIDDETFELRLMSPAELRTEVSELRAKLRNVRSALNNLIRSIETEHGDGEEEDEDDGLDGVVDADLIHADLEGVLALLGPDPDEAAPVASDTEDQS